MNKQAFRIANVTESEYIQWCKENDKAAYKSDVKAEFFERIADGRLVRDIKTNKLIRKNRRHK